MAKQTKAKSKTDGNAKVSITVWTTAALKTEVFKCAFEKDFTRSKDGKVQGQATKMFNILLKYALAHFDAAWAWYANGESDMPKPTVSATDAETRGKDVKVSAT